MTNRRARNCSYHCWKGGRGVLKANPVAVDCCMRAVFLILCGRRGFSAMLFLHVTALKARPAPLTPWRRPSVRRRLLIGHEESAWLAGACDAVDLGSAEVSNRTWIDRLCTVNACALDGMGRAFLGSHQPAMQLHSISPLSTRNRKMTRRFLEGPSGASDAVDLVSGRQR